MNDTFHNALVDASERVEAEATLAPALATLSELADIDASRITLESCIEQLTMADGSIVDVLEAEQTYLEWRASHSDLLSGQSRAQTGEALIDEIRDAVAVLNNPAMESNLIQNLKRSFHAMSTSLRTFGKNLVDIKTKLNVNRSRIAENPVMLSSASTYSFLTRDNKPVNKMSSSIDQDLKFIEACESKYQMLFERSTEMGKKFREAANSDSNEVIREAIDFFDENILDRTEFNDLTRFKLLGNRTVVMDKRGYPQFKKSPIPWSFTSKEDDEHNLPTMLAKKKIHGFSIGGPITAVKGVVGLNSVVAKKKVAEQIKASGGETEVGDFVKVIDKTLALNTRAVKFAQMAAAMSEKVQRLSSDMDDAYNHVNTEKTQQENVTRVRELRALHRAARRSVSQYMFLGKAIATMMEDHSNYVYRNVTLIAHDVLKQTSKPRKEKK